MKIINKKNVATAVAIIAIAAWLIIVAYTVVNFDSIVLQNEQTVAILNILSVLIVAEPLKALIVVALYCTIVGSGITFAVMELSSVAAQKRN